MEREWLDSKKRRAPAAGGYHGTRNGGNSFNAAAEGGNSPHRDSDSATANAHAAAGIPSAAQQLRGGCTGGNSRLGLFVTSIPMLRFVFRFTGLWLLAGAFVAFVIDGTRSISAAHIVITRTGDAWESLHPASFDAMRAWIELHLPLWVWNPIVLSVLLTPLWIVLGLFGLALVLMGRKRRHSIGYSSRD
jgi:hypothetical protein